MKRRRRRVRYQKGGVFKGTNRQRGRRIKKTKQTGGFLYHLLRGRSKNPLENPFLY